MATSIHHRVVVIGGGTAGISVAARLRRAGADVGVIEPSATHDYQPFWTLVGAGVVPASKSRRTETSVMPDGVDWIRTAATGVDPEERVVHTTTAGDVGYDVLVVSPGIQLDWGEIPGLEPSLGHDGVSSVYTFDLAPRTWDFIRSTRSGTGSACGRMRSGSSSNR